MTLFIGLFILVPVVVAALAVRACVNAPRLATPAVVLAFGAVGLGIAAAGRIDEVPVEGTFSLLGSLVCLVLLRLVVRKAKSVGTPE